MEFAQIKLNNPQSSPQKNEKKDVFWCTIFTHIRAPTLQSDVREAEGFCRITLRAEAGHNPNGWKQLRLELFKMDKLNYHLPQTDFSIAGAALTTHIAASCCPLHLFSNHFIQLSHAAARSVRVVFERTTAACTLSCFDHNQLLSWGACWQRCSQGARWQENQRDSYLKET